VASVAELALHGQIFGHWPESDNECKTHPQALALTNLGIAGTVFGAGLATSVVGGLRAGSPVGKAALIGAGVGVALTGPMYAVGTLLDGYCF
jgi:hypothetical protein